MAVIIAVPDFIVAICGMTSFDGTTGGFAGVWGITATVADAGFTASARTSEPVPPGPRLELHAR
jgi:hypothetical protein